MDKPQIEPEKGRNLFIMKQNHLMKKKSLVVKKKLDGRELPWGIIALVSLILSILLRNILGPLHLLGLLLFFIFVISLGIWGIRPIIDFIKKRRSFGLDLPPRAFLVLSIYSQVIYLLWPLIIADQENLAIIYVGMFSGLNMMLFMLTGIIWAIKSGIDFVRKRGT